MANASLEPIYDRLNGVPQYHPFSAKTFTDWASEAGDTVQISREGTVYTAPVHKQSLVWRGKHMINMQSTGTRERTPIERMSNQKANDTSAGMSSSRGYGGGAGKAIKALQYDFYDEDGIYHSQLYMDEQRFTTIFTKTGLDDVHEGTTMMTMINQNATEISLEAIRARNNEADLSGRITVEAGKITQIVSAVGANGQVTAASIVLAINESTGQGEAKIDADHVYIGNSKSTTVIAGKLSTNELAARIADLAIVSMVAAHVDANLVCDGAVSVGSALAVNQSYGITNGGTGTFSGVKIGSYSTFTDCVIDASVSGNVLTLTKASGGTVTFSKATTLTGDWSGSYQAGKKYVVIAKQNNVQVATDESPIVNSVAKYGSPSWSSGNATYDQQVLVQDSDANSIYLGTIDVKNIYDSGYSNGYPSGTITIGSKITGSTYNVSISPTSGTAKATTKDFSSIYADARDGYTQGTFTLASVTLQGQRVTGTAYHTVDTGGTVYYTAGSAVTRLGSSVTPTAVSGYRRGSSVSMSRDTIYRKGTGGAYTEIGYCYYCQSSAGASTLYKGGDYFSYNDVGTSSTLYYAGSSVTPISGGGLRLSTVTAYQAGSTVSNTYYTKS